MRAQRVKLYGVGHPLGARQSVYAKSIYPAIASILLRPDRHTIYGLLYDIGLAAAVSLELE